MLARQMFYHLSHSAASSSLYRRKSSVRSSGLVNVTVF
jgi:hypothetical protein